MNPGKLDQRIQFQRATLTDDGAGGKLSSWATVKTVWAAVKAMNGREILDRGGMVAAAKVRFTVRNGGPSVTETDRISWSGKMYNIREILAEGNRPMYLEIIAERGVSS